MTRERTVEARYIARPRGDGAEIVDTARGGISIAWCGNSVLIEPGMTIRLRGIDEAAAIAQLLNDAELPPEGDAEANDG